MPKSFCHNEVMRHNGPKSLWVVIHNDIFDLTKFAKEHPGGAAPLLDFSGRDATQAFELAGHSDGARSMMCKYKIGTLPVHERTSHHKVCDKNTRHLNRNAVVMIVPSTSGPAMGVATKKSSLSQRSSKSSAKSEKRVTCLGDDSSDASKLKWLMLALAAAIVIGIVVKKYQT